MDSLTWTDVKRSLMLEGSPVSGGDGGEAGGTDGGIGNLF